MREVMIEMSFSSAHALRGYRGKCENTHGHNYRVEVYVRGQELNEIGLDFEPGTRIYRAVGCQACDNTGYRGRTGIYELFVITEEARGLILNKKPSGVLRRYAIEHGMVSLRDDGWAKVRAGITTIEELLRVTQEAT